MKQEKHVFGIVQRYRVECYGPDGELKWRDGFDNLVPTVGRNKYLDATLVTGLASPVWYVGLKGAGTVVAADTMASHAGWTEITAYSNVNRPTWTPGSVSAGAVSNTASKAVFNINGTATVTGAFVADNNTKGGTTGTLLGAGDFDVARNVVNGDTLNVEVEFVATSS